MLTRERYAIEVDKDKLKIIIITTTFIIFINTEIGNIVVQKFKK